MADEGLDPEMAAKIRIIEQMKEKAVQGENFDYAKQLKECTDRIRSIGLHLGQLEERKRMATDNEDYDAAKILKMEMEKLKQAAFNPWIEEQIRNYMGHQGMAMKQQMQPGSQFNVS